MITLNKKRVGYLLATLCILASLASIFFITPKQAYAEKAERIQHIYDEAGLLSTEDIELLEQMCIKYGEKGGLEILILTHDDPNTVDGEEYIEDFYDTKVYGNSVIMLVDMYRRDVVLEGYGEAQYKLNSKRLDIIREDLTPYLSDGEYYDAFEIFIKGAEKYMNYVPIYLRAWFQLIIALVIGAVTVSIMAYSAGGAMTAGANNYIDNNHSGLIGRRDQYIRTRVTRVRKPQQSSGGGSGGISKGGHSHSTSRGKF